MTASPQLRASSPVPKQSVLGRIWAPFRNAWRGLTSMRTALILLFLLAIAAIPGALIPQRSLNSQKVDQYLADHPTVGPWMDRAELFDVFGSFWFTAIYVLLFVSLIGCIAPRIVEFAQALRAQPVTAPRNLARLPHSRSAVVTADPEVVVGAFEQELRGWRTVTRTGGPRARDERERTVSAEKGYLRELGNLVFHISLVGLLAAIAIGKLTSYEGNRILIADGDSFCSTSPAAFDSFRAGNIVDGTELHPMCLQVDDFTADYRDNGQADMFRSNIRYQSGSDIEAGIWRDAQLEVNKPLRTGGDRVYLQGHGYAPTFTVIFPDGQERSETIQWAPTEQMTFLSSGVMRFDPPGGTYPDSDDRRKHQIAIEGLFAPTAQMSGTLLASAFPAMRDPAVAVDIYRGDAGLDTGKPQSIFELDQSLINQGRLVKQTRVNLYPGESTTLDDGTQIRFDGAVDFVNLQVSHDPAQGWALVFALSALVGLVVSLTVKRRRVWIRVTPLDTDTTSRRTVVELGGLARTDQAGWGDEFDRLADRLLRQPEIGLTDEQAPAAPGRGAPRPQEAR